MKRNKQYKRFGGNHPSTETRNIYNAYRRGDIRSGQAQIIRRIMRNQPDPVMEAFGRLRELEGRICDGIVSALKDATGTKEDI